MAKTLEELHQAAVAWLRGEDKYQFGKFPHAQDVGYLQEPIRSGVWGQQFGNNTRRAELFARGATDMPADHPNRHQLIQKALQAAGKVAASGRGLYVVISRLAEPEADEETLRQHSFAIVEDADPRELAQGVYTAVPDVWATPLGKALDELDAQLTRPVSSDTIGAGHTALVEQVYGQASSLLLDKMVVCAPAEGVPLPRPGVPSGTIEPWTTYPE